MKDVFLSLPGCTLFKSGDQSRIYAAALLHAPARKNGDYCLP